MALSTASSASLTRYPRWVWAVTGLTAAYATYTLWSIYIDAESRTPNASGLHRRGAIRHPRRRSPQQEQQLLANMHASPQRADLSVNDSETSPFGTVTASVNDHEQVYQIGPNPPTLQDLRNDFQIRDVTLRRIHADMQHVLLDIIIERLVESDSTALLTSSGPAYTSLLPLVEPLRERNIDDLLANIHLLALGNSAANDGVGSTWRYDQSNVALAFARRCGVDVERARSNNLNNPVSDHFLDGLDTDPADSVISNSSAQNTPEPGQGIKGLLYAIAEEQAHRTAYTHRGTRCDSCGEFPIKGVRWHCINCADYDLCSPCESLSPSVHPRTHVFAKIKIPISTLAQPHQVHDLWYPGDPLRHWPTLKVSLRKKLASEFDFEDVVLEALYEQFTCLANVAYPNDPADIKAAIDRRAFNKAMSSDKWPAPLEPNFLFDRMFSFYDTDNNSLIGFEEFVSGLAYLRQPGALRHKKRDLKRVLKGYDVDGDGLLSRADFVRMMSAKYAVQRHIIRDVVAAEEAEIVAHTGDVVRSSQPISAAFTGEDVPYGEARIPDAKQPDAFGDLQMTAEGQLSGVILPNDGQIWDGDTVDIVARRYQRPQDGTTDAEAFRLRHSENMRERYSRVDNVPIPAIQEHDIEESWEDGNNHVQRTRYLVETDPRANRGIPTLAPAEVRWATDLNDSIAGGASGSASPGMQQQHTSPLLSEGNVDNESADTFPEFIVDRGRSYPVPGNELPFGREVLYQVIQESINELLDPLFRGKEKLAHDIRATRKERQRWRARIDEFSRKRQEMRVGANADPLLGTAQGVIEDDEGLSREQHATANNRDMDAGARRGSDLTGPRYEDRSWDIDGSGSSGSNTDEDRNPLFVSHNESLRSAAPSPTASQPAIGEQSPLEVLSLDVQQSSLSADDGAEDFASTIRQQLLQDGQTLPTDDDGLEDLEFNIRHQPLEDLLESAGYSIASPEELSAASAPESAALVIDGREEEISRGSYEQESHAQTGEGHSITPQVRRESASVPLASALVLPATSEISDHQEDVYDEDAGVSDNHTRTDSGEDIDEDEDSMHLSPSFPPTPPVGQHTSDSPFLASLPDSVPPRSAVNGNVNGDAETDSSNKITGKNPAKLDDTPPSQNKLEYYSKLDEEERQILRRGGPARLTYEEVEELCMQNGGSAGLLGLIEGWLEWAGF